MAAPQAAGFVNRCKDEGQRPTDLAGDDPIQRQYQRIYTVYQQECERGGLVDFGELLLRAYELWRDNPELLAHYRERFQHVLVDEFQDTNTSNTDGCGCWATVGATCSSSATTTSASTAGGDRRSRIFNASPTTSPVPPPSGWSRTTAPRTTF